MKLIALLIVTAIAASAADPAPKKPAAPAKKPGAPGKKPTRAKPQRSIGDLALDEAKKVDENHDGKITGIEVSKLQAVYRNNPKSWLSIYNGNGNHSLDDTEISEIKWTAAPPPAKPAPAKPAPKAPPKKK